MKYAFFDFCGTITKTQTADRFVYFVIKETNYKNNYYCLIQLALKVLNIKLLNKIINKVFKINLLKKKLILLQLKGISKKVIDELSLKYYEILKNELHINIVQKIKSFSNSHKVILISAGYNPYIEHFVKDHNISVRICNRFKYKDLVFSGKIDGDDIYGRNKINILKKYIKDYDYNNSFSYSDCISDLPLLKFAKNGFVISNVKHNWIINNGLNWIKSDV